MNKTYSGVLNKTYFAPKKVINTLGERFVFINGICETIPEEIAFSLLGKGVLDRIFLRPDFSTSESPIIMDSPEEVEEVPFDFPPLPNFFEDDIVEGELINEEKTPEKNLITRDLLEFLYEEHKTWSAVASHLDLSMSKLKSYREEFGL
jgi:hypothetical protein